MCSSPDVRASPVLDAVDTAQLEENIWAHVRTNRVITRPARKAIASVTRRGACARFRLLSSRPEVCMTFKLRASIICEFADSALDAIEGHDAACPGELAECLADVCVTHMVRAELEMIHAECSIRIARSLTRLLACESVAERAFVGMLRGGERFIHPEMDARHAAIVLTALARVARNARATIGRTPAVFSSAFIAMAFRLALCGANDALAFVHHNAEFLQDAIDEESLTAKMLATHGAIPSDANWRREFVKFAIRCKSSRFGLAEFFKAFVLDAVEQIAADNARPRRLAPFLDPLDAESRARVDEIARLCDKALEAPDCGVSSGPGPSSGEKTGVASGTKRALDQPTSDARCTRRKVSKD